MIYLVDSWAWIEYFIGSKGGFVLKKLLDNKNHKFITMECTLTELKSYCLRTGNNFNQMRNVLKRNSVILPVLNRHWLDAADIRHEIRKKVKDFGLIDAILVAKQNELKCMIISGDRHFIGMKNIVYVGDK
ncbi:PIN domain-containing protein [Candidatus Woesearchaeota archaeon]|nr:PIN domain-containing protein [Candidatus Woesearchaeota archaeon]